MATSHPLMTGGGEQENIAPDHLLQRTPEQEEINRLLSLFNEQSVLVENLRGEITQLRTSAGQGFASLENQIATTKHAANKVSTPVKVPQPPKFKGVREGPKILEWAHQATTYLRSAGLENEEQGMWHITSFFDSDAAIWWRLYCDRMENGLVEKPRFWRDLKHLLVEQFQVFNHITDVRDRYQALRQTGTVSAYINKFRSLVVELHNEPEELQIYQFLKGLKPEIQARTRTHKPPTLNVAMDIADEADRAHYHAYGVAPRNSTAPKPRSTGGSGPTPMDIGAVGVSPVDMMRLRQQNRCFYCRKEGHQAKECKKRKNDRQGRNNRNNNKNQARSKSSGRKSYRDLAENF